MRKLGELRIQCVRILPLDWACRDKPLLIFMRYMLLGLCGVLVGCAPALPNDAGVTPATAIPTADDVALCAVGTDAETFVEARVDALQTVYERGGTCSQGDVAQLLYDTYIVAGDFMRDAGSRETAEALYEEALAILPEGVVAQERIADLGPERTLESDTCEVAGDELPDYIPTERRFAVLDDVGFLVNNVPLEIEGVNYYPSQSPFERFLVETELAAVEDELLLVAEAGLNTVRLFLHPDVLFVCDTTPITERFLMLDAIFGVAAENDLRVIMVLNAGITPDRLFAASDVDDAQMAFIVGRYAEEPTILAWDLYENANLGAGRNVALAWLAETALAVRALDDRHPITVSWGALAEATAPLVDFVSFQHAGTESDLRQHIANLQAITERPLFLSEVGYSTFEFGEIEQRDRLFRVFDIADNTGLVGWTVSWAFDFPRTVTCTPPDCPGEAQALNQYGLWNTGYFPKLALDAIYAQTGVVVESD